MSEIDYAPLSDLVEEIVDNRGRTCPTSDQGIPLIATNCIKEDSIYPTHEKVRYVSDETYREWFRGHPRPGDILFVNKGTPGRVCLAPDPIDFCIAQDMVALRADKSAVSPQYLFAALRSPQVKASIDNMHVGTMIPHFKKGDFDKLLIPLPSRSDQERIGGIYCDFSLAIENKRKTNETLEAMAKALFKSWFVDFDPVRAKAEGRPTGLPAEISDLFPDSFEDSELGEIPSGWRVAELGDISTISGGKQLESVELKSKGRFPVYGANGTMGFHDLATHNSFVIVFGRVGAYCGSINWEYGGAWVNNNASSVIPLKYNELVLQRMLEADYSNYRTGSAQPFIPNGALACSPVLMPTDALASVLCDLLLPIRLKQKKNQLAALSLVEIRDALLPKLISGEIRIPDAENMLEEVGV